ncbi:TPA: MarR family transcriptional regulator [Salmonella enterica subsp. enterica serovar Eastbourne]|nr:MarR family transcriptional regulator [Salmonella enterica subsp. enterica serovar Eastbourne]
MKKSYSPEQSLGFQSGLTSRLFNLTLMRRFQGEGIAMSAEQWGTLLVLVRLGPMTQSTLGELLLLEKSSISRLVDGLEKRNWIKRVTPLDDCRKRLISPTSRATEIVELCTTIAAGVLEDATRNLSPDELRMYQQIQAKIIGNLKETL